LEVGGNHTREEFLALAKAVGNICLECREPVPVIELVEDHIIPLSGGGDNSIGNIQPLCRECNEMKGATTMNWLTDYALEGVVV